MSFNIPNYEKILDYFFENFKLAYDYNSGDINKLKSLVNKHAKYNENEFLNIEKLKPTFFTWKSWEFPVFFNPSTNYIEDNKINFDIYLNTFLLLSGIQEWTSEDLDSHERFKYKNSIQFKHNFTSTPVINIYFEIYYKLAKKNGINISKKSFDSPIVFTHDIDQLRSGWYEDIGFELKNFSIKSIWNISKSLVAKISGLKDSYYKAYEKITEIETENNISSISFFMAKKSHLDGDYDVNKKKNSKLITARHPENEIGLHPGYHTYNNKEEFINQLAILKKHCSHPLTKIRQHFLKYNVKTTPIIHENLGITHDFSLGFAENFGFRNSIATPFYLFNFNKNESYTIIEIPLFFMEGTLTHYMKGDRFEHINSVITLTKKLVSDFNTNFSILFHNTAFSDKKYRGFSDMYSQFILIKNSVTKDEQ